MNLNADRGSAIASSSLDDRSKFDSKYFEMLADPGNQSHNNADNYLDSTAKSLVESHEREEDIEKDTVVSQLREILAFKDKVKPYTVPFGKHGFHFLSSRSVLSVVFCVFH